MKTNSLTRLYFAFLLTVTMVSCEKSDYTVENQSVSGNFSYVTTSLIPIEVDTTTQQPLSANISMDGTGTISEMGELHMVTSFKFDFVLGKGSDFVTTYTISTAGDSFTAIGSSQRQQDGSIVVTESFSNGKGKFEKIKGGGKTTVLLNQNGSGGTGSAIWTVTY
jgi:hypothetical protein